MIPNAVYSQIGPIPVEVVDGMADKDENPTFGLFCRQKRTIKLDAGQTVESQLATLMHECVHVALWDSGAHNNMTERMGETVCDAVGSYFAAAILAGYIKLEP